MACAYPKEDRRLRVQLLRGAGHLAGVLTVHDKGTPAGQEAARESGLASYLDLPRTCRPPKLFNTEAASHNWWKFDLAISYAPVSSKSILLGNQRFLYPSFRKDQFDWFLLQCL